MATYTYDDFEKAAKSSGLWDQFSQFDLDTAQKYPQFGQSILNLKQNWQSAATDEERQQINERANQLRSSYGNYTGGADGSQYISTGLLPNKIDDTLEQIGNYGSFSFDQAKPEYSNQYAGDIADLWAQQKNYGSFSFDTPAPEYSNQYAAQQQALLNELLNQGKFSYDTPAPEYSNQYAEQQKALLNEILNREAFSWSKETDPQWAPYKKEYLREGERATANALAQASAASGGRPSSYAVNAASQAGDYYAAKLSDIIPTLYQQAYERYLNEYQMKQSDLAAVNNQEQLDYAKFLDQLSQYNTDRNFALSTYQSNYNTALNNLNAVNNQEQLDYSKYLNALSQWNTDRSFDYNAWLDGYNMIAQNLNTAQGLEQNDYNKFVNELNQWNTDRNFAYNDYQNQYNMLQTYLGNLQSQDTTEYNRAWDEEARAYERAQAQKAQAQAEVNAILGVGGTPSADLISKSGYSEDYAQAFINEWERQQTEQQQAALRELADWYAGYGDYSQLAGLGVDTSYLGAMQNAQLASKSSSGSSGGSSGGGNSGDTGDVYSKLLASGATDYGTAYAALVAAGYSTTAADTIAAYFEGTYYPANSSKGLQVDMTSVLALGYGPISETRLNELVQSGEVEEYEENGLLKFRKVEKPKDLSTLKPSEWLGLR